MTFRSVALAVAAVVSSPAAKTSMAGSVLDATTTTTTSSHSPIIPPSQTAIDGRPSVLPTILKKIGSSSSDASTAPAPASSSLKGPVGDGVYQNIKLCVSVSDGVKKTQSRKVEHASHEDACHSSVKDSSDVVRTNKDVTEHTTHDLTRKRDRRVIGGDIVASESTQTYSSSVVRAGVKSAPLCLEEATMKVAKDAKKQTSSTSTVATAELGLRNGEVRKVRVAVDAKGSDNNSNLFTSNCMEEVASSISSFIGDANATKL